MLGKRALPRREEGGTRVKGRATFAADVLGPLVAKRPLSVQEAEQSQELEPEAAHSSGSGSAQSAGPQESQPANADKRAESGSHDWKQRPEGTWTCKMF